MIQIQIIIYRWQDDSKQVSKKIVGFGLKTFLHEHLDEDCVVALYSPDKQSHSIMQPLDPAQDSRILSSSHNPT